MKKLYLVYFEKEHDSISLLMDNLGRNYKISNTQFVISSDLIAKDIIENIINQIQFKCFVFEIKEGNFWGRMESQFWDWIRSEGLNLVN